MYHLSNDIKAQVDKHIDLCDWFPFKDYIMGRTDLDDNLKGEIICYGVSQMMSKYHNRIP